MDYRAGSWNKPSRVVEKIERRFDELFPRYYLIVINSRLPADKVVKVYMDVEMLKSDQRRQKHAALDTTSCHWFACERSPTGNEFSRVQPAPSDPAFLSVGRRTRRSIEWIIMRLVKRGARISYHARRWYVHLASTFPLAHHYRAVLEWQAFIPLKNLVTLEGEALWRQLPPHNSE